MNGKRVPGKDDKDLETEYNGRRDEQKSCRTSAGE
jgi:hypothetical protein